MGNESDCLNLSYNSLSSVSDVITTRFGHITTLILNNNNISKIDGVIGSLTNLQHLDLNQNKISRICINDFTPLINLKCLKLSGNDLTYISPKCFYNLSKLIVLDLSENNLGLLSAPLFSQNVNLTKLNLRNSNLEIGMNLFQSLIKLETLNLCDNNLQSFSKYTFKGLKRLKTLKLSNNRLTNWKNDFTTNCFKLRDLEIDGNCIFAIQEVSFNKLIFLQYINLKGCDPYLSIKPSTFKNNKMLKNVTIGYLMYFPFNELENLENLCLDSRNFFTTDTKERKLPDFFFKFANKNLKCLKISETALSIKCLILFNSSMTTLTQLNLAKNHLVGLKDFIFANLVHLKSLVLNNNELLCLDCTLFAKNNSLEFLSLSNCALKFITDKSFINLNNLSVLILNHNNFVCGLSKSIFNNLLKLTDIDLSNSKLKELPLDIFQNNTELKIARLENKKMKYFDLEIIKNCKKLEFLSY